MLLFSHKCELLMQTIQCSYNGCYCDICDVYMSTFDVTHAAH